MQSPHQFATALGPVLSPARDLAAQMDADTQASYLSDRLMDIVFPERADDDAFRELMHRTTYDNLDMIWRIIAGRDELETSPPFAAISLIDAAVQLGIPLSQFERIYRVGVALVWSLWYAAALEWSTTHDVPLGDLLGGPSMVVHSYVDSQMSLMLDRYETAQAEQARTREQLQVGVLRRALESDEPLEEPWIATALGVPVDGTHVALALQVDRDPTETGLLPQVLRAVPGARAVQLRHGVRLWLVWLSHPAEIGPACVAELREVLGRARVRCALGEPAQGPRGLGSTGRDALEAARLQEMLGDDAEPVISFDELRLESFILSEPARARRFVHDELAGLDADDSRTEVLRDTARLWLSTGSHVSTATRLGVHEHTVRNRIVQIEALVGRPVIKRRTELLVALRIKRLLSTAQTPTTT